MSQMPDFEISAELCRQELEGRAAAGKELSADDQQLLRLWRAMTERDEAQQEVETIGRNIAAAQTTLSRIKHTTTFHTTRGQIVTNRITEEYHKARDLKECIEDDTSLLEIAPRASN